MISTFILGGAPTTIAIFIELLVAGAIVIKAGTVFATLADTLSDRLNLASGWVGLILVATVTSLPEVVSGSTAAWIGNTDMAIAALFGSCSFNVTLIFLLNFLVRGGSVLRAVSHAHNLTSSFGLFLMGLALFGVLLSTKFGDRPSLAAICELIWAVAIFATYVGCMRLTYSFEKRIGQQEHDDAPKPFGTWNYCKLATTAIVIVLAAWWLAQIGDVLSTHEIGLLGRPLGATFVGAGFLALATSLPEITTSVAAVRIGNLNLALGNIFGSNMFNIFVIPMIKVVSMIRGDDLLLNPGQFNATESVITGMLAILLTSIAVGGLTYKSKRVLLGRWGMGFDSILIGIVYVGGMALLLFDG